MNAETCLPADEAKSLFEQLSVEEQRTILDLLKSLTSKQ
jgi:hypothetical protein